MWSAPINDLNKKWALDFEISSYCNATCPGCARFVYGTPVRHPSLRQNNVTLEQFKDWITPAILAKTDHIAFCGNFGDCAMNPEFVPILEYIREYNDCDIIIRTNGGARKPDFWRDVGRLATTVIFSVDGLEDTNHLYRRGIKWSKIVENAKALNETNIYSEWEYLVFRENAHQKDEARRLAKEWGFNAIQFKRPYGMDDEFNKRHIPLVVRDKNGNSTYGLHLDKEDYFDDFEIDEWDVTQMGALQVNNYEFEVPGDVVNLEGYSEQEKFDIQCKMIKLEGQAMMMHINAQGLVLPCCFWGSEIYRNYNDDIFNQVNKILPPDTIDLKQHSFEHIMQVLDDKVYNKFTCSHIAGRPLRCSLVCGWKNPLDDEVYNTDKAVV